EPEAEATSHLVGPVAALVGIVESKIVLAPMRVLRIVTQWQLAALGVEPELFAWKQPAVGAPGPTRAATSARIRAEHRQCLSDVPQEAVHLGAGVRVLIRVGFEEACKPADELANPIEGQEGAVLVFEYRFKLEQVHAGARPPRRWRQRRQQVVHAAALAVQLRDVLWLGPTQLAGDEVAVVAIDGISGLVVALG